MEIAIIIISLVGFGAVLGLIKLINNAEKQQERELFARYLRECEEKRLARIAELARIRIENELAGLAWRNKLPNRN